MMRVEDCAAAPNTQPQPQPQPGWQEKYPERPKLNPKRNWKKLRQREWKGRHIEEQTIRDEPSVRVLDEVSLLSLSFSFSPSHPHPPRHIGERAAGTQHTRGARADLGGPKREAEEGRGGSSAASGGAPRSAT